MNIVLGIIIFSVVAVGSVLLIISILPSIEEKIEKRKLKLLENSGIVNFKVVPDETNEYTLYHVRIKYNMIDGKVIERIVRGNLNEECVKVNLASGRVINRFEENYYGMDNCLYLTRSFDTTRATDTREYKYLNFHDEDGVNYEINESSISYIETEEFTETVTKTTGKLVRIGGKNETITQL